MAARFSFERTSPLENGTTASLGTFLIPLANSIQSTAMGPKLTCWTAEDATIWL